MVQGFAPLPNKPMGYNAFLRYDRQRRSHIRRLYEPKSLMDFHASALRNQQRDDMIEQKVKLRKKKEEAREAKEVEEQARIKETKAKDEAQRSNKSYRKERGLPEREK